MPTRGVAPSRFNCRKVHLYTAAFVIVFLIFVLTSPRLVSNSFLRHTTIDDEGNVFGPPESEESSNLENSATSTNSARHYKFVVLITSSIQDIARRKLFRESILDIHDNLVPCQQPENAKIYYRFLVNNVKPTKERPLEQAVLREFKSETIEFDDVVQLNHVSGQGWQESALRWADKLDIDYDQLVIVDIYTLVNFEKLQKIFEKSIISGRTLTSIQKRNLLLGSFESPLADDILVILGSEAVPTIIRAIPSVNASPLVTKTNATNILTKVYYYYQRNTKDPIYVINDSIGILEWTNVVESVSLETTVAVGHVYQDVEFKELITWLNVPKTQICRPPSTHQNSDKPSIVIVTSSFVYKDMCMIDAAVPSADNKRDYARKHGYSFVARSAEFAQQPLRKRKTVWGKVDAVEKILPRYDWLFWMDMDAVIANFDVTIEGLIQKFVEKAGGREAFEEKHLIVSRPNGDNMINAGVFLLRNSDWSRRYLREVQGKRNQYFGSFYEQRAMWDILLEQKWRGGVLLLDRDDHTFNTFPKRYAPGDFVVHYAPDGCPAKPVMSALAKIEKLREDPNARVDFATTN